MELPLRLELRERRSNAFFRFTIVLQFMLEPKSNDVVALMQGWWPNRIISRVQYVYHAVGEQEGAIVYAVSENDSFDDMMANFDMIKDAFDITDFETNQNEPPSYYIAYRVVSGVLGYNRHAFSQTNDVVLATVIKASLMLADCFNSGDIESLYNILINVKKSGDSDIDISKLMQLWDADTSKCQYFVNLNVQSVALTTKEMLSKLKSIDSNDLPESLK